LRISTLLAIHTRKLWVLYLLNSTCIMEKNLVTLASLSTLRCFTTCFTWIMQIKSYDIVSAPCASISYFCNFHTLIPPRIFCTHTRSNHFPYSFIYYIIRLILHNHFLLIYKSLSKTIRWIYIKMLVVVCLRTFEIA
jgi:hypothetical protein